MKWVLTAAIFLLAITTARAASGFGDLRYRWVGPAVMGGRLDAVAGVPGDPKTLYLGHSSGGLWKSLNSGLSFTSVFETGTSSAVGAIAIDPRNPRRIFIGTGEAFPRNTADAGDGLWRSDDAGAHWRRLGFEDGGSIAKIAIDPADSNVVLVAVLGHEFAPSAQRGIYRSTDGGEHFTRTLFVSSTTGGSDLSFAPGQRGVVYAGTFDFLRRPWSMRSGGPGSGLYRSSDAGATWQRLTDPRLHNGLPPGPINRVGVSVCARNPQTVYAFVPVRNGMLYRSTDGGRHWQLRNASQDINFRPFYFSQVRCDPADAERVYAIGGALLVSKDGGRVFKDAGGGGDNHDLWIDPQDPRRLVNGSDMGLHLSLDGGRTWNYDDVIPFAQIYRVGYDMDEPYHVMGGLQDHEVWWGPSQLFSRNDGPGDGDWLDISDWGDGQYAMADPHDSSIVYEDTHFGDLVRANLKTGERRYISPQPIISFGTGASTYAYRFNWSAPLLLSRFDSKVLYFGGNVLFRSNDQGSTWRQISSDLTRCDPDQLQPSGGPITFDDTNAETYCTIYSIAEDPKDPAVVWYGTDNGHVELTRDGGRTWSDRLSAAAGVTLPGRISCVSTSQVLSGTAYIAVDRHQWDDYQPYAYVTHDYGRSWRRLGAGLAGYVHVIREDPRNSAVLYAGTERGAFVSFDAGASWSDLRLGLPHVPVFDLQVHPRDNDLIVGSHGRGFYILDDLTPLQQWAAAGAGSNPFLFAPMPAYRYNDGPYHEHGRGEFVSDNKPYGALITLYLPQAPPSAQHGKPTIRVRVLDGQGKEVDVFQTDVHQGFNRFAWDLQTEPPGGLLAVQDPRPYYIFYPMSIAGAQVLPGTYTVEADVPNAVLRAPVTVLMDPRNPVTAAELQGQFTALETLAAIQERAETAMRQLNALHTRMSRAHSPPFAQVDARVTSLLDELRNPEPSGYRRPARLSEQIAYLRDTISQ
ncbi:MAG TPA: hypothetical protein VFE17_04785, partial [Candidatus Baltobacteraceae bacterium]|nr:hypothetical protein [Candidatus Baltobacteraceae bacterium]